MDISIVNKTTELADCRSAWFLDEKHGCWCLEDILYAPKGKVPLFQRMSIYAPRKLMAPGGIVQEAAKHVPVVFENNAAGYMQMPHSWLDGPRCNARQYLDAGFVYVTCGCSGRESRDPEGKLTGKAPATLVDLKTAIRFLRHNRESVPGDLEKIISVGTSAGGAMSSLLAVTGDYPDYLPYLKENGAFLEESDAVFAAQIYCPIIDLAHADQAYEWMFGADKTCEDSHAGPAETMTPFKEALSKILAGQYITYFNGLELYDPAAGKTLSLNADGRSGSAYDYLMGKLEEAAAKYLSRLPGKEGFTAEEYLSGDYTFLAPVPEPPGNKDAHHAGPGMDIPEKPERPLSLGELMLRPPRGQELPPMEPKLALQQGTDKRNWLSWDGNHARIRDLDSYVLNHRGRMKPCTSFDVLPMTSGENQVFGTPEQDFVHYNTAIAEAVDALKDSYPEEYALYYAAYAAAEKDTGLQERMRLMDPMPFIGTQAPCTQAKHYRIRVGGRDADTAATVSMALALKLQKYSCGSVDYAIVWEQPHCDADYPGEVCDWIRKICG